MVFFFFLDNFFLRTMIIMIIIVKLDWNQTFGTKKSEKKKIHDFGLFEFRKKFFVFFLGKRKITSLLISLTFLLPFYIYFFFRSEKIKSEKNILQPNKYIMIHNLLLGEVHYIEDEGVFN